MTIVRLICLSLFVLLASCSSEQNDPYPASERGKNILYAAFTERPKHLDPVQSYTEDEYAFTEQIYEPPLQYHYLKRPYTLIPATVEAVPLPRYYDASGRALPADAPAEAIARSVYEIRIRPGIRYQPHPAFALDAAGQPLYAGLDRSRLRGIETIDDFAHSGTRELVADDYIYEIKRLAHPRLHSPIFGMMAGRIIGLKELGAALQRAAQGQPRSPGSISTASPSRAPRASIATRCASRSPASIRSSSTGWRCPSSRRCRVKSTASTASRGWPRRT